MNPTVFLFKKNIRSSLPEKRRVEKVSTQSFDEGMMERFFDSWLLHRRLGVLRDALDDRCSLWRGIQSHALFIGEHFCDAFDFLQ